MAGERSQTITFDAIATSTLAKYRPKLVDNISNDTPLLRWFTTGGRKRTEDGGDGVIEPLLYELGDGKWYSKYDELNTTDDGGITNARYDWRQYAVPVAISGHEMRVNKGEAAIIKLLESKVMRAQLTLQRDLTTALFSAGGTPDGSTAAQVSGLALLVQDSPNNATAVGGITPSTSTWWQNQTHSGGAYQNSTNTHLVQPVQQFLMKLMNDCSKGADRPDLVVCMQTIWEYLFYTTEPSRRYTRDEDTRRLGVDNFRFGSAAVYYDPAFTTTTAQTDAGAAGTAFEAYALNSKYLSFVTLNGADMDFTDMVRPANQDAWCKQLLLEAALTCSNRERQGYLYGVTAE